MITRLFKEIMITSYDTSMLWCNDIIEKCIRSGNQKVSNYNTGQTRVSQPHQMGLEALLRHLKQYRDIQETYNSMKYKVLDSLRDLYILEYQYHLLQTDYLYLITDKTISNIQIESKLSEIVNCLKEFVFTNVMLPYILSHDISITKYKSGNEINIYRLREDIYSIIFRESEFCIKGIDPWRGDRSGKAMNRQGLYSRNYKYVSEVINLLNTNHINSKIIGISLFFNIFHDDCRGLIIGTGNEEYPHVLIPLKLYMNATRINHRLIEYNLKKELTGY